MFEARCRYRGAVAATALWAFLGCQKTYYTLLEQVGVEKRELLAERVGRAKQSQQEAEREFRDALEKFQAVTGHRGGDLEGRYDRLRAAYERSDRRAHEVSERIGAVEDVATALIDEWKDELDRYDDRSLRRRSEARLHETERDVHHLLRSMRQAEHSLDPVLQRLEDRVLFVKHNLDAAALAGLEQDVPALERDVERLEREIRESVAEADRFIAHDD